MTVTAVHATGIGTVALLAVAAGALLSQHRTPTVADHWQTLDRYCVTCHNGIERAGDLELDALRGTDPVANEAVWEKTIRKLRTGMMPPVGEPRPAARRLADVAGWLEGSLDAHASAAPNPGAPVLHRLNRTEYANAIRDLLALPVDAATLLPGDDSSGSFDNIANALSFSPALLQAYVSAAAKVSRLAVGDPAAGGAVTTYRAPRGLQQGQHLEGQPLGTRGGLLIRHVFPLDAEYEIRVARAGGGFGLETVGNDEDVEITVNGERAALLPRTGARSATLRIASGPQTLGVALVRKRDAQGVDDLYSVHAASPGIANVSIVGPLNATGVGDTPSRRELFVCSPSGASDEPTCARQILRKLAARAYRRPVADDDAALATLVRFYEQGRAEGSFDAGIQRAVARVLVDPEFLFRFEAEPTDVADGATYRLTANEFASRLSFFLWSSIPDDALREAAANGELEQPAVFEREVRRMLADPKAEALVQNFASQWLLLRQLDTASPVGSEFDGNLRLAMRKETELLFASVLREDRSVVDLLDASYTFVDERLARHYGIDDIRGSRFRRVELPPAVRRGLLGHGSILTVTSAPNRTSPVKRGQWILQNILGAPVPPPPEGVERNLDTTAPASAPTTVRDRLERHQKDPACAGCHKLMDPLGYALENFDFIGRWRDADAGAPVDVRGEFVDGSRLDGPAGLRRLLLERRELFVTTVAANLLTYAVGRALEPYDMPAVREIVRRAAKDQYRFSALVLAVAQSVPMTMKVKMPAASATQARAD